MARAFHFISNNVPGYGPPDGRCLLLSGVPGRSVNASSCSSPSDHKYCRTLKSVRLTCTARTTLYVCNASPGGQQRNPDFSRPNRKVFSRNRDRNRQYEDRDNFGNLDDSEMFPPKNGSVHSGSGSLKFQATAAPGPREKEIVELFRKVQAQLRERAAMKEEKKIDEGRGKGKENETVDSLLKLLKKHSVQQGKKSSGDSITKDFLQEQAEPSGPSTEDKSFSAFGSKRVVKQQQNSETPVNSRPRSSFQRRSPIRQVNAQTAFENTVGSLEQIAKNYEGGLKSETVVIPEHDLESEVVDIPEHDLESESDTEQIFSDEDVYAGMSEDESEETHEPEADKEDEDDSDDLSEMKLPELKALAKSRGIKGFSKLKKQELIELLGGH